MHMKNLLKWFGFIALAAVIVFAMAGCENGITPISNANQTPVADDFVIGNLTQTVGSVTAVTIIPKEGKSSGTITIYYDGLTTIPTAVGTYPVTFDVAAATGFDAATGLAAGTLTINATNQTPVADDFVIGNLTQTVGSVTMVTITPKAGKSDGAITIYYNGSTTLPSTTGTYTVTFDVTAATGFNAAVGLVAGTLTITAATPTNQTPVADDFVIGNLTQTVGNIIAVTITPKTDKSSGTITIYYNGSTTLPTTVGTYPVTFDVATATGFDAATGLSAGTLTINATNQTPVADDFVIGNLIQTVGSVTMVTITPKAGKSNGAITVYYNGSTTLPTAVGTYTVTFDVAAATGFDAAVGLSAGTLTINETTSANQTPVADDFVIGNLTQTAGSVIAVTITPKADKSTGAITIYYNGSTALPTAVGTYTVTFDVAAATGFNAAVGLAAGTLTINETTSANQTPVASDFDISNLTQTVGSVTMVTITPKAGKSTGAITIYYNGSTTLPTAVGTYTVTFDVAAATGFNATTGLSAGTLTINNGTIGVLFSGFGDEAIDLTKSTENDIHIGESLTITVDGDFDTYHWYMNGLDYGYSYNNSYHLNITYLNLGNHISTGINTITAVVTKNDVPYSKAVTFRVVN